ncbi:hypothetical protein OAK35_00695 [Crocinitomicaceae bacterium]|nr:hypothetical protein [Crocinitomicaceae bacterium]
MKRILLASALMLIGSVSFGQNINDHKINFNFIQLPLLKIDTQYDNYSVKVEHAYRQANEDSTVMFSARQEVAMQLFMQSNEQYHRERDSLERIYLAQMSSWEQKVNAGTTNPDGTQLAQPVAPMYPPAPVMDLIEAPMSHSEFQENMATDRINLSGYTKGEGEVEITITIHPIRSYRIVESKKGTGASTKYNYTARYVMPIGLRVANPSQGIMMETTLYESERTYNLPSQKSKYDHELYMKDNKETFFRQMETAGRNSAISQLNDHLNNHFGFVQRTRSAEIYSVKSFKGFDYTDVTNAFTQITLALQAVGSDRDRSGAMSLIDAAISATETILAESNIGDKKSRINDKVTAMLQCNLAELYMWKADFNKCDGLANLAMNSGEGKAKRHIRDEMGFYKDQRNRWDVHY